MKRDGFTLVELLLVMAIMGMMGLMSVGGYRAMQRGIEERGVMENVNKFIAAAYQRSQIERVPVALYFWNETLRDENEDSSDTMIVVGRAVAVRRSGRLTAIWNNNYLGDEFGDLRFSRVILKDEDETTEGTDAGSTDKRNGMFLYPMKDNSDMSRSLIAQSTVSKKLTLKMASSRDASEEVSVYAFQLLEPGGVTWKVGDAYGFEFADLTLPHNYIFGSSFSQSASGASVKEIGKLYFKPGKNSGSGSSGGTSGAATIEVSSLRPGSTGVIAAQSIGKSDNPGK